MKLKSNMLKGSQQLKKEKIKDPGKLSLKDKKKVVKSLLSKTLHSKLIHLLQDSYNKVIKSEKSTDRNEDFANKFYESLLSLSLEKDGLSLGILVQHVIETLGIDAEGFKAEIKEYAQEAFTSLDNIYKKITTVDQSFLGNYKRFINKLLSPYNMIDLDTKDTFKKAKEEVSNKFRIRIRSQQKNNSKQYCLS